MANQRASSSKTAGLVEIVVDTPQGSRNKYKYDERRDVYLLHKVLPIGASFPFDFGFIPDTEADDGDAVDVIVLGEEPTFTGCRITVRLLGAIEAEQTEQGNTIRNDRLIATAETPKIHPRERSLEDLAPGLLDQIEHFFIAYNRAEDRVFTPIGRRDSRWAARLVEAGRRRWRGSQDEIVTRAGNGARGPAPAGRTARQRRARASANRGHARRS